MVIGDEHPECDSVKTTEQQAFVNSVVNKINNESDEINVGEFQF